jgi:hypothetical protein
LPCHKIFPVHPVHPVHLETFQNIFCSRRHTFGSVMMWSEFVQVLFIRNLADHRFKLF